MRSFAQKTKWSEANNVLPSWNRRGGRAAKKYRRMHPLIGTDGVVSPDQSRMTTPSAPSKDASRLFLDAQPPLLFQEGTTFCETDLPFHTSASQNSSAHEGGKQ